MQSVPLELPVSAAETRTLAELLLDQLDRRTLNDAARNRLASRIQSLRLASFAPYPASIVKDPIHPSTYYIAADAQGKPLLLRTALASSPSSGLFPKAVLIGRMRTESGREVVVNAVPFGPKDHKAIATFAEQMDKAFLPRPQGAQPAVAVETKNPAAILPAAFEAFGTIQKRFGVNMAGVQAVDHFEEFYYAALWAAIRAGWRAGFTIGADVDSKSDIASLARYTKFTLRADADAAPQIHEAIQRAKAGRNQWRHYDLEDWPAQFKQCGKSRRINPDALAAERIAEEIVQCAEELR